MVYELKGLTVLVTGAAEGLGFCMVDNFLENGAKLALILDINEQKGAQAVETLTAKYGNNRAAFMKCDVTKDLEDVFNKVISKYGYVDLVVNNAGVVADKDLQKTIDINVTALITWSMKFYDFMRKDRGGKGGTIINISSIYGYRVLPYLPYYHASKFAVMGFSRSLGHKANFETSGVRVVTLCPGLTHSPLSDKLQIREDEFLPKFYELVEAEDWQAPDFIGKGAVAIFNQAEPGEVWLVEGERPATKLNF